MKKCFNKIAVVAFIVFAPAVTYADSVEVPSYPMVYGYLDVHAGHDTGSETDSWNSPSPTDWYDWNSSIAGGSGSVAVVFSPTYSYQIDAWDNSYRGNETDTWNGGSYTYSYRTSYPAIAGHFTRRGLGGIFVSYGHATKRGDLATVGVEAFRNAAHWHIYGQVGYTGGASGQVSGYSLKIPYGQGVVKYYFNPNLVMSGNLGFSHSQSTYYHENDVTGGVRLEGKFASVPVAAYVAYQGYHWKGTSNYPNSYHGNENLIMVGLRVLFGSKTLQENTQNVGLVDMNPYYGSFPD